MVKKLLISALWLLSTAIALSGASCSTPPPAGREPITNQTVTTGESELSGAHRLWARSSGGIVIELSAAGSWVLASIIPDHDGGGLARKNQILGLSDQGRILWRKDTKTPVKSQALAQDGSLGVFSTYDDRATALNSKGKILWSVEAVCRPLPILRTRSILCFHDDDAEPEIAFEILDWKTGAKLSSFPSREDILGLKVAQDERHFAISLAGGHVIAFELQAGKPGFKQLWDKRFKSEVLDLSVSSQSLAVLTEDQKLQTFDLAGKPTGEISLKTRVEQIELLPQGSGVIAFDNSARGQTLIYLETPGLNEKWRKQDPEPSNYTAPLLVDDDHVTVRFGSSNEKSMKSQLFSYGSDGHAAWVLPLEQGEGSQLYAQKRAGKGDRVFVATDDGDIRAYEMGDKVK